MYSGAQLHGEKPDCPQAFNTLATHHLDIDILLSDSWDAIRLSPELHTFIFAEFKCRNVIVKNLLRVDRNLHLQFSIKENAEAGIGASPKTNIAKMQFTVSLKHDKIIFLKYF